MFKLKVTDNRTGEIYEDLVLGVGTEELVQVINFDGNSRWDKWEDLTIEVVGWEAE